MKILIPSFSLWVSKLLCWQKSLGFFPRYFAMLDHIICWWPFNYRVPSKIEEIRTNLKTTFEMTDIGLLHYFIGMEVYQSHGGIFLSQHRYLRQLLETYSMSNCRPLSYPMDPNSKLSREDNSPIFEDITKYKRLIGSLLHLTYTKPNLSYSVSILS